jgi:hypothetical protein
MEQMRCFVELFPILHYPARHLTCVKAPSPCTTSILLPLGYEEAMQASKDQAMLYMYIGKEGANLFQKQQYSFSVLVLDRQIEGSVSRFD